ncbi:DUF485 domain-containing protein [Azohydromonas sediminis]|uniref:DUF485 domain-containing protein n=1 Tax=Azohydromonas sediminis TaxID=2259674 RepID=UPI000E6509BF|nr:DUF485 domain-containing protein [Azohydromonas sediminis]
MDDALVKKIAAPPRYLELQAARSRFGWTLTIAMLVVCYGFILLVAFDKELLAQRIGSRVMTIGMPLGVGVIVFTVVLTVVYVKRAHRAFDALADEVGKAALR